MNTPIHLVDDEVIEVVGHDSGKRRRVSVRLQVWRAKDVPAVVLATQIPGNGLPADASCAIANRAWRSFLGHSEHGMRYFEAESDNLWEVTFVTVGHAKRATLIRPEYTYRMFGKLDALIGRHHFGMEHDLAA